MKEYVLQILMTFPYLFMFASHFKIVTQKWQYTVDTVDSIVRLFICLTLLIKFNIFQRTPLTHFDKIVGFNAGLLLLSSTILNSYKIQMMKYVENNIKRVNPLLP
jgi:hypothetical protein